MLWWDIRKMGEPTESLILDPTKKQDMTKAQGAMALEYEPTIVSSSWIKFILKPMFRTTKKQQQQTNKTNLLLLVI